MLVCHLAKKSLNNRRVGKFLKGKNKSLLGVCPMEVTESLKYKIFCLVLLLCLLNVGMLIAHVPTWVLTVLNIAVYVYIWLLLLPYVENPTTTHLTKD